MSRRRPGQYRSRGSLTILKICIHMRSDIPFAAAVLRQGCSPKWCRALWGTSITAPPLTSISMCRRANIRKKLGSLRGRWNWRKRKVKNLRKNGLSGWDRHLGKDMEAVLLLGSGLHILKEIKVRNKL